MWIQPSQLISSWYAHTTCVIRAGRASGTLITRHLPTHHWITHTYFCKPSEWVWIHRHLDRFLGNISFVNDCKMKTLCQKMLKFCKFLSDLQRNRFWKFEQIIRRLSSNLSCNFYVWREWPINDSPNHFFLVKYWLKLLYFITFK